MADMDSMQLRPRFFQLPKESELRVEVGSDASLRLQLVAGAAEIFGTGLPPRYWLSFPPLHKFAVFTWNGATVEIDGTAEVAYIADETPVASYANVHAALECRRCQARDATSAAPLIWPASQRFGTRPQLQGPRTVIVGPTDSGKSSLTRTLLGWAARQGWMPTFVDLDIGQGSITIPGTIAATPIKMPIDPIDGVPLEAPLVHFYGHTTPSVNADLYRALTKELAHMLDTLFLGNVDARISGMLINTMGWVEGLGYELLLHVIEAFNADSILVLGQEKLYHMLSDMFRSKSGIDILKLHKSGGVVARSPKYRQQMRNSRIKEYFYGLNNELSPHATYVNFSDLRVFRIGDSAEDFRSSSPIAAESAADSTCIVPITISHDLVHAVLAVSYAKDPEHLLQSNVAGFIYVTDVDMQRKKVAYVAPCPGPLPNNLLIAGTLSWVE